MDGSDGLQLEKTLNGNIRKYGAPWVLSLDPQFSFIIKKCILYQIIHRMYFESKIISTDPTFSHRIHSCNGYPQFSLWKRRPYLHSHNLRKNNSVIAGTVPKAIWILMPKHHFTSSPTMRSSIVYYKIPIKYQVSVTKF